MRLFHISDLHFQADIPLSRLPSLGWRQLLAQTEYRFLGRRAKFMKVVETTARLLAEAERLKADHLLVSGDLTALALPEEFEEAKRHLASWSGRMTIIPGNHDRYTPEAAKARAFEEAFAAELKSDLHGFEKEDHYPIIKLVGDDLAMIGLCSARVPLSPGFASGWVGRTQRRVLREILAHPEVREGQLRQLPPRAVSKERQARSGHSRLAGRRQGPRHLARGRGPSARPRTHSRPLSHRPPSHAPIFCAGSSTQQGIEGYFVYDIAPATLDAKSVFFEEPRPVSTF